MTMSSCRAKPEFRLAAPTARELLRQHATEPVVRGAAAAELLGNGEAKQPCLPADSQVAAVDDPPLVPVVEVRGDLAVDELAHGGPEVLVLGAEEPVVPMHAVRLFGRPDS